MSDQDSEVYCGLSRNQYLVQLAKEYEVSTQLVFEIANTLGPDEDFDGLITEIEDYIEQVYEDCELDYDLMED